MVDENENKDLDYGLLDVVVRDHLINEYLLIQSFYLNDLNEQVHFQVPLLHLHHHPLNYPIHFLINYKIRIY